ncbi:MAG TPA: hypothetical protein PL051_01340 [Candidatus Saccharibacteria bacterium]|nr:hypothetical protein [Candidatus Saccharibacteria bacterium]
MSTQPPDTVKGYTEALAAGILPTVPKTAPTKVIINANTALLLLIAGIFFAVIAGINVMNTLSVSGWAAILIFLPVVILVVLSFIIPYKIRNKEYIAGYSYVDNRVSTDGVTLREFLKVQNYAGPAGYRWDMRGLWKLNSNGTLNRPPVDGILPIGYYPSPNITDKFQYWTGAEWLDRYCSVSDIPAGGRLEI